MNTPASSNQSILQSKQVLEMLTIANDFTAFIEKAEDLTKEELLLYLHRIFPLIYLKASLLPSIEVTDEEAIEHYVTEQEWEAVFITLRAKLASDDEYQYIDLHEKSHQDSLKASISENVADIYQDLKDFLMLYQKPVYTFKENAIRECRHLFVSRYGNLLVNGLVAIHYLLYESDDQLVS